jgi:hypothetical protein
VSDKEKMMVAFNKGECLVLFYAGLGIHGDIDGMGASEMNVGGSSVPDHGVWVWEGIPKMVFTGTGDYGGEEFDHVNYDNAGWRKPTDEEWDTLKRGESPWEWELETQQVKIGGEEWVMEVDPSVVKIK